ncbi:AAA domain-containing protein [[Mycoplasma] collis]|uniref:AAA domain-containing protein n=1 Tax=[Mycoplasma] collis TaxID=2127 RepID=UPI00068EB3ED|nr:AAA domain-containing protein [[Mycoplasma] collis]
MSSEIRNKLKNNNSNNLNNDIKIQNLVLVGFSKNKNPELNWKTNGAAIFFDCYIFSDKSEYISKIRRIEFLNLNQLLNNNKIIEKIKFEKISVSSIKRKDRLEPTLVNKYKTFLNILNKINKTVNWKDEHFQANLKIEEWFKLIEKSRNYFNNKKSFNEIIFTLNNNLVKHEINELIANNEKFIVLSPNNRTNKEDIMNIKKFYIYDAKDFDKKIQIEFKNKNFNWYKKVDDFKNDILNKYIKQKDDQINEKDNEINEIKNNNDLLENEKKENQNKIDEIKEIEYKTFEEIEIIQNEINDFKNEKTSFEKNIYNFKKEIEKLNSKNSSKKTKEEINNFEIKNKISVLEKNILDLKSKIEEIVKEIQNNEEKLKKLETENKKNKQELEKLKREEKKIQTKISANNKQISYIENIEIPNFKKQKEIYEKVNTYISDKKNEIKQIYWNVEIDKINNNKNSENNNNEVSISLDLNFDKFNISNFPYLNNDETGTKIKIYRYDDAFQSIKFGQYKNPYLLKSLSEFKKLNSENLEIAKKQLDESKILEKYKLNQKQKDSLIKFIATQDVFYLQGPPGTGKTQTICAIAEHSISKNNENILITSSTHEAIENFLDRINEMNPDDPKIILYKFNSSFNNNKNYKKNKKTIFDEEHLYTNFVEKISNFYISKFNENKVNELYDLTKKLKLNKMKISNMYNFYNNLKESFDNKSKNSNNLFNLEEIEEFNKNFKILNTEELEESKSLSPIVRNRVISDMLDEIYTKINENLDLINLFSIWEKLNDLDKKQFLSNLKNNDISIYSEYLKQKNNNHSKTNLYENIFIEKDKEFKKYIFENNLINVFGITTTSKTQIDILSSTRDLFFDYPIDTIIFDEISKSSTPEILSRIIMAKKIIFSGDYKQLPPSKDLSDELIGKIFNQKNDKNLDSLNNYENEDYTEDYVDEFSYDHNEDYDDEESMESKLKDLKQKINEVDKLYKKSFFVEQVKKMKTENVKNMSYEYLKVQHRFTNEIMEFVNLFYDNDEKLEEPKDERNKVKNNFTFSSFNSKKYENSPILISTDRFNDEYFQFLKNKKIEKLDESATFDQNKSIAFDIKDKITNSGQFNEYNAYIIIKLLYKFKENNKEIDLTNKIGVITLTRNQVLIIKHLINKDEELSRLKIKVDTIDNFQGREKEIIIVDFVRAKNKYENNAIKDLGLKRNLDFLKTNERVNVAISRVKKFLFLIGDFEYYSNSNINRNSLETPLVCKIYEKFINKYSNQIEEAGDWNE